MNNVKRMCELFGNNIPQNEKELLDSVINKLETDVGFEHFTTIEFHYLEKSYKAIYK